MSNKELCNIIARIWVGEGGDEEGFDACYSLLKKAIADEIKSKEAKMKNLITEEATQLAKDKDNWERNEGHLKEIKEIPEANAIFIALVNTVRR